MATQPSASNKTNMSKLETIIGQASELNTADLGELIPRITDLLKRKLDKKSQLKLKLNLARKDWHPITKIWTPN